MLSEGLRPEGVHRAHQLGRAGNGRKMELLWFFHM